MASQNRGAEPGRRGQYFGPQGDLPATIVLYVPSLYRGIPKVYWLSPVITLQLARILAHEVGHHLIKQRGYVFERGERVEPREYEEELANRYSFSVRKRMLRRWYYRVADWLTPDLAGWHYVIGLVNGATAGMKRRPPVGRQLFALIRIVQTPITGTTKRKGARNQDARQDNRFTEK